MHTNEVLKEKYDLIFSLGEACSCTQILRKCHLQFYSYPFDWLFGADILARVNIIANNYDDFIKIDDLEDLNQTNRDKKNPCEIYKNKKNNICFNHDFKYNVPLEKSYPDVEKKYKRRAERQIEQIEASNTILAVYIQSPNTPNEIEDSKLIEALNILKNRFQDKKINLLYLYCNRENKEPSPKVINENIVKISFDYDGYNKDLPYVVNGKILQKIFCKLKITNKFVTTKNNLKRYFYLIKCFFRGML